MVASCNNCMHAEESLGTRLEKSTYLNVTASHVHEQKFYRECGNLHAVILEVKVVMNEPLEM